MAKAAAKKTPTKGGGARKAAGGGGRMKPISEPMNKSALARHISENSGVAPRDVKAVLQSLEDTMCASLNKKGCGLFTLPGLLKVTTTQVAAKPRRRGKDPFTGEERWFEAKPASVKVKARPLKKLKAAAS